MSHTLFLSYIITFLLLIGTTLSFDIQSNTNVVAYWGQGSGQGTLASYCTTNEVDIIVLSFLNGFPTLELNFGNQCSDTFSDGLLHCSQIGQDIQTCQQAGVKVLLSLGGAVGTYGFSSDSQAQDFASVLWNKFGAGTSDSERPFDSAVVDGFDFDIENDNQTGYVALVNQLRTFFGTDTSKTYYISAAPQCPYPDQSVGDLLSQADVDFAFIQFYNNYCSLSGGQFNWNTWENFALTVSPNKDIKLFVGLPGSVSSAGSGYVDISTVSSTISTIISDPAFGGISIWDVSTASSNIIGSQNFLQSLKSTLVSLVGNPSEEEIVSQSSSTIVISSSSSSTSVSPTSFDPVVYEVAEPSISTDTTYDISTTVITITSCSNNACQTQAVTTGYSIIASLNSTYTTYVALSPLTTAQSSAPAQIIPTASNVDPNTAEETTTYTVTKTIYSTIGVTDAVPETTINPAFTLFSQYVNTTTAGPVNNEVFETTTDDVIIDPATDAADAVTTSDPTTGADPITTVYSSSSAIVQANSVYQNLSSSISQSSYLPSNSTTFAPSTFINSTTSSESEIIESTVSLSYITVTVTSKSTTTAMPIEAAAIIKNVVATTSEGPTTSTSSSSTSSVATVEASVSNGANSLSFNMASAVMLVMVMGLLV